MIWKKKSVSAPGAPAKAAGGHASDADCTALCCATRGESVCVRALLGCAAESARLREMGLCEGARLQVLRKGNPLVVRVADSRLGLAHAVAERVLVAPVAEPVV
jgi:Fe2+ transport system protein FeoA